MDPSGSTQLLTGGSGVVWASWGHRESEDVHSWPTWSPDGTHLAAFRIDRSGRGNRVWVSDVWGVRGAEVAAMGDRVPIYLQWSLDGTSLGALSQDSEVLVLQVADPTGAEPDHELLRGSPLFFSWVNGNRIAAFVGEGTSSKSRMSIVTPQGPRHELVGAPGNFCAPVRVARGIAYVAQVRNNVLVLVSSLDGTQVRELEQVDGLVAIVGRPGGTHLARAISPDGSGTPYERLELLDVETATSTLISDRTCLAFFWLPSGDGLILAHAEEHTQEITWFRLSLDGSEEELFRLVPSRDTRVYLRFFEQYGPSHPIIDPTGQQLVLCGTLAGDRDASSRVFLIPLDGSTPEVVSDGLFASFAPKASVQEP